MDPALLSLAEKLARELVVELAKVRPHVHGEWLGRLEYERANGLYQVRQPSEDPLRLWVPELGFEYAYRGRFLSDGGSIPKILQKIPYLHLQPDAYLRSYFTHDYGYEHEYIWCRPRGAETWTQLPVDRVMMDCILYIGLTAENATLADARIIYRAVRVAGESAWRRCRKKI